MVRRNHGLPANFSIKFINNPGNVRGQQKSWRPRKAIIMNPVVIFSVFVVVNTICSTTVSAAKLPSPPSRENKKDGAAGNIGMSKVSYCISVKIISYAFQTF